MDESEFIRRAEQTLQEIDRRVEASGIDADCEFSGTGVLEIEFADRSKIIVNSQAAAREIRVAPKSGGYHFRHDGARWVGGGGQSRSRWRPAGRTKLAFVAGAKRLSP